jgi:hypothetical protein
MMRIEVILIVKMLFVVIVIQSKLNSNQQQKANFVNCVLVIGSNLKKIFFFREEKIKNFLYFLFIKDKLVL